MKTVENQRSKGFVDRNGEADRDGEPLPSAGVGALAEVSVVQVFAAVSDGRFRPTGDADRPRAIFLIVHEDAGAFLALTAGDFLDVLDGVATSPVFPEVGGRRAGTCRSS